MKNVRKLAAVGALFASMIISTLAALLAAVLPRRAGLAIPTAHLRLADSVEWKAIHEADCGRGQERKFAA
jgi:hypothetical protein